MRGKYPSWEVSMANTSGADLTMSVYVVCASAPATPGAAARQVGARIVSRALSKISKAKG